MVDTYYDPSTDPLQLELEQRRAAKIISPEKPTTGRLTSAEDIAANAAGGAYDPEKDPLAKELDRRLNPPKQPDTLPQIQARFVPSKEVTGDVKSKEQLKAEAAQNDVQDLEARKQHFTGVLKSSQNDDSTVDFNPTKGPSDDISIKARAWMGRSKSDRDLMQKFQEEYPDGRIRPAVDPEGKDTFLYRIDPEHPYRELNLGGPGLAAKVVSPQFVLGGGAAALTGGASIIPQAITGGIGAAAGSLIDQGIERGQGYAGSAHPYGDAALEGITTAGGLAATKVPQTLGNLSKRWENFRVEDLMKKDPEYGRPMQDAASREGLEPAFIGQVSDRPMIQKKLAQAAGTNRIVSAALDKQQISLEERLNKLRDSGYPLSHTQLSMLTNIQKRQALNELQSATGDFGEIGTSEAKDIANTGINKYSASSKQLVANNYEDLDKAFIREKGYFDSSPLKGIWDDIKEGKLASSNALNRTPTGQFYNPGVQTQSIPSSIQKIGDRIDDLGKTLKTINSPSGKPNAATSGLNQIRADLHDLVMNGSEKERDLAGELLSGLRQVQSTPKNISPGTKLLIDRANSEADTREANLSFFTNKSGDPKNIGPNIFRPGNADVVDKMKDVMPDTFNDLKATLYNEWVQDPKKIGPRLLDMQRDKPLLNSLMSTDEQNAWEAYGFQMKKLDESVTQSVRRNYPGPDRASIDMLYGPKKMDARELDEALRADSLASGLGPITSTTSPLAEDLRAGVFRKAIEDAKVIDSTAATRPGSTAADEKRVFSLTQLKTNLEGVLKDIDTGRLSAIFSDADRQTVKDLTLYTDMLVKSGRVGGQFQSGAITAEMFSPVKLMKDPEHYGFVTAALVNNASLARILTRPDSARLAMASLDKGPTSEGLRLMAAAASIAAAKTYEGRAPLASTPKE